MTNIIIANIISVFEALFSFYRTSVINRRRQIKLNIIGYIINAICYYILGAFTGFTGGLWGIIKSIYMLLKYKGEDKIKINNTEAIIMNCPIIIFSIIGFNKDGWIGIIYGIMGFINGCGYWWKKDISRMTSSIFVQISFMLYNFVKLDFVKVIKNIINTIINISNIIRLQINGENKYYKDLKNVS